MTFEIQLMVTLDFLEAERRIFEACHVGAVIDKSCNVILTSEKKKGNESFLLPKVHKYV